VHTKVRHLDIVFVILSNVNVSWAFVENEVLLVADGLGIRDTKIWLVF